MISTQMTLAPKTQALAEQVSTSGRHSHVAPGGEGVDKVTHPQRPRGT